MDIIATELRITRNDAAHGRLASATDAGAVQSARVESLDIETVVSNHLLLSSNRKWAIRFNAGGTVTIVLGMRDYGRGWFSAYFAGLVSARLGIPFKQVRIYYSGTLPAVLRTPVPSSNGFRSRPYRPGCDGRGRYHRRNVRPSDREGTADRVISISYRLQSVYIRPKLKRGTTVSLVIAVTYYPVDVSGGN